MQKRIKNTILAKLMRFTPQAVLGWRKQERPIIALIEKYFQKEEIEEFLENGKIEKFEKSRDESEIETSQMLKIREILKKHFYDNKSKKDAVLVAVCYIQFLNFLENCLKNDYKNSEIFPNPFFTFFSLFLQKNNDIALEIEILSKMNELLDEFEKNQLWFFFIKTIQTRRRLLDIFDFIDKYLDA